MIKELFVTYEIAVKLKEKGLKEQCLGYFETPATFNLFDTEYGSLNLSDEMNGEGVLAPTWMQAIDWLREERGIFIELTNGLIGYNYHIKKRDENINYHSSGKTYSTYYLALQSGIEKALELI